MRILVIEDEPKLVEFLRKGLEENCYEVQVAYDGQMGYKLASSYGFDLIILDIILPVLNGIDTCIRIRENNKSIPILMLTALGSTEDKIAGFDAGADDYLVKPFDFMELLARIRALSKRSTNNIHTSGILKIADLELDLDKKIAARNPKIISLTAKEFLLLEFLMRNKGRVVSRAEIAEKVWELKFDTGTNVVDVYINILRKKIYKDFSKKLIQTRIGLGYSIDDN
jgi:DNA-binding response OmpR family regulator